MKIKTSELRDTPLAWAVAKILQLEIDDTEKTVLFYEGEPFLPDTYWQQGGPIIEQERIELRGDGDGGWIAYDNLNPEQAGPTPLVAAMRCYVASRLGSEVDVPDDLVWDELIYEGDQE